MRISESDGTLLSTQGSGVNNVAASNGSAAFLAPPISRPLASATAANAKRPSLFQRIGRTRGHGGFEQGELIECFPVWLLARYRNGNSATPMRCNYTRIAYYGISLNDGTNDGAH